MLKASGRAATPNQNFAPTLAQSQRDLLECRPLPVSFRAERGPISAPIGIGPSDPFYTTYFPPREGAACTRRKIIMFRRFRPERQSLSAKHGAKPQGTSASLDSLAPWRVPTRMNQAISIRSGGPQADHRCLRNRCRDWHLMTQLLVRAWHFGRAGLQPRRLLERKGLGL